MLLLPLVMQVTPPTDRQYILQTTALPMAQVVTCVSEFWEDQGVSDITPTDYGTKVDFRYSNLGGAVKEPTMTMEVHEGEKRTLLLYGFGAWRGAIKGAWKSTAKRCFPEIRDVEVVKAK